MFEPGSNNEVVEMAADLRRVLVTGAAGMVGEETVKALLQWPDRYRVIAFDLPTGAVRRILKRFRNKIDVMLGDLTSPRDVQGAVSRVDDVIHLAAIIPPAADRNPEEATAVNVHGTRVLLEALADRARPVRFLFTSSIAVYGDRLTRPWINVQDPPNPGEEDHYARTKLEAERLIRESGTHYTIFRLTGVLSHRLSMNPLMFEMPLDTSFESITARDAGYALAKALENVELEGGTYNLGGGPRCRAKYRQYLDSHLSIMGLGSSFFPDAAFAESGFHCGYYSDSDSLDELLEFQRDGLDDWWDEVRDRVNPMVTILARGARPLIRWLLLRQSRPLMINKTEQSAREKPLARPL